MKIDSDVPKSATVGKPAPRFVIDAAVPVSVAITKGLVRVGAKVVEGTVEAKIVVAAPQGDLDVIMPVDVKTNIPAFGPFYVKETGAVPALTFSRPGSAKITVGDLILHLTPKDASGNVVFPGKFRALCKLDAGQNNVVASFGITGTRTTTGSVTSGTVDTTTSGTTRSKTSESTGSPTDGTTRPATFGTSGTTTGLASGDGTWGMRRYMSDAGREGSTTDSSTGPPSSPRTTGGQDTEGLILLAVSTLVVAATFALALKIQRNRTI